MKIQLVTNTDKVIKQLDKDSIAMERAMKFAMFRAMSILEAEIKQNIRTNSGLNVRTGTLLNSIQQRIFTENGVVRGTIGPENVPYAAIHEFGGVIPARFVSPVRKKALRFFNKDGQARFSKGHIIPQISIPARPYLSPAIASTSDKILEVFSIFVAEQLKLNRG